MYSDEFMIAFGCFIKGTLVLCVMPVLMWILIYRKIKNKSNKWLIEWVLD